jgi:hypothetical protein
MKIHEEAGTLINEIENKINEQIEKQNNRENEIRKAQEAVDEIRKLSN